MEGVQVPEIPFIDVAGKLNEPPEQIAPTCVNCGLTVGLTVTVAVAHVDSKQLSVEMFLTK